MPPEAPTALLSPPPLRLLPGGAIPVRNDREVVETSASFEARFRATTLPDR